MPKSVVTLGNRTFPSTARGTEYAVCKPFTADGGVVVGLDCGKKFGLRNGMVLKTRRVSGHPLACSRHEALEMAALVGIRRDGVQHTFSCQPNPF